MIEAACQGAYKRGNRIEVLTDGPAFYPAMLEAIRSARETVNMEVYMFKRGEAAEQFIEALADRARAGVRVTLVMDAVGSLGHYRYIAGRLRPHGARVEPYQRLMWYRLARLNNRTHRELLVIDGEVAFVGGAGIADWWLKPLHGKPIWRDLMARIEGPVVTAIQGIAAENYLECCGAILSGPEVYKAQPEVGESGAFVVKSSPADRATASRVLFQTLIEGAERSVRISTPYFLPDKAFRRALKRVIARGVSITAIVPGPGDRSALPAACEPAFVRDAHQGRHEDPRVPARHDPREDDGRRRPLVGDRLDEPRQPVVRAQRRDERGDPRSRDRGAADA